MYSLYKFIETIKIPIPIFKINSIQKFECYHILWKTNSINLNKIDHIHELFKTNKKSLPYTCFLEKNDIFYIGPSFTRKTPWSSNVQQIINNANINEIKSVEKFTVYVTNYTSNLNKKMNYSKARDYIHQLFHDTICENIYENLDTWKFIKQIDQYNNLFKLSKESILNNLKDIDCKYGLSLSDWDIEYIHNNIDKWDNPIFYIFDLSQSNSEHSRHHFFNGNLILDNELLDHTLFKLVKAPIKFKKMRNERKDNSLIAFKDNSSVIRGSKSNQFTFKYPNKIYEIDKKNCNYVLTAETHNFPTGIEPFSGAATGIGGRIRDVQSTGRGAFTLAGTAGYCVGEIDTVNIIKNNYEDYPTNVKNPLEILIKASNGASDYGNKYGEPIVLGFTRSFRSNNFGNKTRKEWLKPIMFTAGLGLISDANVIKEKADVNMKIAKIGGPTYRIGMNGGSASSRVSKKSNQFLDKNAVQRGDPEVEQRMNRFVRTCIELGNKNPILSIHDQGAGGNGNVLKEIIEEKGCIIDLEKLTKGDNSMNYLELWLAEYQESNALLFDARNESFMKQIAERENIHFDVLGDVLDPNMGINIYCGEKVIVENYDYPKEIPKRDYHLQTNFKKLKPFPKNYFMKENDQYEYIYNLENDFFKVLSSITVGSKRFLTNKVDRSVSGLIAQQQCVGPLATPLSNFALLSDSMFPIKDAKFTGIATSIGEQPILSLLDPIAMVQKTFSEMLTNLMWCKISNIEDIKCSANWMWPNPHKNPKEGFKMYAAMKELTRLMTLFRTAVDGGKDSLSMSVKYKKYNIDSPGTLVLSSYVRCPNIYNKITPDIKKSGSCLYFIDLSSKASEPRKMRMGGCSLLRTKKEFEYTVPKLDFEDGLHHSFKIIQYCIDHNLILSGHDKSDGGLITTLLEMAFSSNKGLHISLPEDVGKNKSHEFLFNEEIGFVIEISSKNKKFIVDLFKKYDIRIEPIAFSLEDNTIEILSVKNNHSILYHNKMTNLRKFWELPSKFLEKQQCNSECVDSESKLLETLYSPNYRFNEIKFNKLFKNQFNVAIIREEGCNSDRELAAAFYHAGFYVHDVTMTDLLKNESNNLLNFYNGIAFCGGFSYSDVLGSANGWHTNIIQSEHLSKQFQDFYKHPEKFSIGICNGCQLMSRLGWIKGINNEKIELTKNISGRFESRFSTIKVKRSKSIFLRDMKKTCFGMWCAHGEGRFTMSEKSFKYLNRKGCLPLRYVDENNKSTEVYPLNPNGSKMGVAAISSECGRHLAVMPHPERSFLKWQVPWMSNKIENKLKYTDYSPWFQMFLNARKWMNSNSVNFF